jgi:beta-mannanase
MKKITNFYLVLILELFIIHFAFAITGPATTTGNLSVGKFYTFSLTPNSAYPDSYSNEWTAGSELTDETYGGSTYSNYVGFLQGSAYSFDIILDLGKSYTIRQARLNCASRTGWGIYYPQSVNIYTRNTSTESWTNFGTIAAITNTSTHSDAWLSYTGNDITARYVKFTINSPGQHTFINEIEVYGDIKNSWKNVPDWGCYHGAYPSVNYSLQISSFEAKVGKKLSMVLWYENMGDAGFASYLGYLWWNSTYAGCLEQGLNYTGSRYLEIGWEPQTGITAAQIAQGYYDSYFKQWFTESITYSNRHNNTDPVWIRAMSEMNGSWTFAGNNAAWGGDPINFRRAWRRMYNVAEQVGAADKHIFLFSPNGVSYPDESWNEPNDYYPGDQYVDWVGMSVYYNSASVAYPSDVIQPFYDEWSYKPMIISEGALNLSNAVDGVQWVNDWFDTQSNFPMVKALVWFDADDFSLSSLGTSVLNTYKQRVSNPYILSQSIAGRMDYNQDYYINFNDYAQLSENWGAKTSNKTGDINGDNKVNFNDLEIMINSWLQ